ncbi:hypothetical protein QJS10_CPB20g00426 [Acorus calamus]|uniref:Uncharacterized protein n=1 Tax=Acorus calamus TaxID=4465 RepID=A0AAV9C9M0_ACOCL|nr:hypothetical protein QJS10_CPB20g00426 [Acorus calamus]
MSGSWILGDWRSKGGSGQCRYINSDINGTRVLRGLPLMGWDSTSRMCLLLMTYEEQLPDNKDRTGHYILLKDAEDHRLGMFDKPLPCFGCGIGWFS